MSVAIRGVTAEFLQKALRRPPAQHRPRGATRRRRRVREEVEVETEVGQDSERRPGELLFQRELHPRSFGGPFAACERERRPSRPRTQGTAAKAHKEGGSFQKGPADCPLQNDYCTYSCITMF